MPFREDQEGVEDFLGEGEDEEEEEEGGVEGAAAVEEVVAEVEDVVVVVGEEGELEGAAVEEKHRICCGKLEQD